MDASKAIISDIFNSVTLVEVPFFQRSYVWKDDLWSRLLDDMEYVVEANKTHFLGSIILKEEPKPSIGANYAKRYLVIDGQQRLTTFLIFMKVLSMKKGDETAFNMQFRIMGKQIALVHGKNDYEAFEQVMETTEAAVLENPKQSRVIDAFNFFVRNINAEKLNYLALVMNVLFVKITLVEGEDEQQIFDTINSLGVNLTTSELLKNYFFSRETISEYENKWECIFEKDDETRKYWEKEIETGRIKRALIDIFFDAYFQLFIQDRRYNISNEDKIMYARVNSISQSYQHFIRNYCGNDKNVVLAQMKEYANCFKQSFNPDYCKMGVPACSGIDRLNVIIFGLKTSTLIPYVLYVAQNVSDEEERNKIYGLLEGYIMRRMIVHATTKNYNNTFDSLIMNQVLDSEDLSKRILSWNDTTTYLPSDEDIQEGFNSSKLINIQTKGIIYLIESHIRPANSATALLGFDNYSLEHLMPKKWRNNWSPCDTEELERKRDDILLTLGNLAIIPQSLNSSIRDAAWAVKVEGAGENKPGLKKCAGGVVTLQQALECMCWDEDKIKERADWLCKNALNLWKI